MTKKLIAHAAEALILKKGKSVIKHRIPKSYRLPQLDEKLRTQRTRREARLLQKAAALIPVPRIITTDESKSILELEYITGDKLADCLDTLPLRKARSLARLLGTQLARLHDAGIIHGDLTTSNMILSADNKLYFIDFGLGFESHSAEDKAVDLHVLKEALEARHYRRARALFSAVLTGYRSSCNAAHVLQRLARVEKRGRYKQQL